MTSSANPAWRPLRERIAGVTGERALVEGTPEYLVGPLQNWLKGVSITEQDMPMHLHLRLRRTNIFGHSYAVLVDGEQLLEVIDAALAIGSESNLSMEAWWNLNARELATILERGGSAWQVKGDRSGLIRRVDETVAAAARQTLQAAPTDAAAHLRRAWEAAYGFAPDATKAYSEAVKSVEAVVIPHTIPNDQVATLGKAITHIKQTAAKWSIAVDQKGTPAPVDALLALLELVWRGQSDRHAGPNTSPVTLESAQTALHAAVTVVQWFTAGAVHKAP